MILYTYLCKNPKCQNEEEHLVNYDERDTVIIECAKCGMPLDRAGVESFKAGKPAFQPGVVLNNGAHIKGHFGKEAKLNKRKK